jgi:phosphatidylinositol alpha-mannosyltransferase
MRTPKIGTHHSYRDHHRLADIVFMLFRGVFEKALNNVQRHIAVSESAASIPHRYYPHMPVTIIPNGIDTRRFSPGLAPLSHYRDGIFTILFVGRMDPRKGAKYLFAALPYLERNLEHYRVLVVGTGWMKKYYDAHIPITLRRRVEFFGYAVPDELPRLYRSADLYCSPATGNESFGIVLLEAMASGVPIVASNIEGYRQLITDGKEGALCSSRDPVDLANKIVARARDPQQRARMSSFGRQTALSYDWSNIVEKILPIYEEIRRK